jgi:hypothetical protein
VSTIPQPIYNGRKKVAISRYSVGASVAIKSSLRGLLRNMSKRWRREKFLMELT